MCLWINPSSDRADGTYGIFSTNCRNGGDSLLDLYVEGGSLKAVLGSSAVSEIPVVSVHVFIAFSYLNKSRF